MSHIPFTITAYLLNAIAVTVDKFLLTKHIPDPLVYVFYFSIVSLLALLLLPFTQIPSIYVLILASLSTLLWTAGAYFMFKAMQVGQVSRVVPVIGTLIPMILLVEAAFKGTINLYQGFAVSILIVGIIFLTLHDWKGEIRKKEIVFILLSAILFAISYVFLRQAYLHQNHFLTVFAWSRMILIPLGLSLLLIPSTRKIVLNKQGPKIKFTKAAMILFGVGQISAGISELLLTFSVSLAEPALVNSLQGSQYAFLFVLSLSLSKKYPESFKEKFTKKTIFTKAMGIIFIAIGLYFLAVYSGSTTT